MTKSNYNDVYIPQDGVGAGHLTIAGKDTLLKLLNSSPPAASHEEFRDHHGILNDGSKASLLECVRMGLTRYGLGDRTQHETSFFPHYVLVGDSFISSDEADVRAIHYHFENAGCLVNTLRTFGTTYPGQEEFKKFLTAEHQRSEKLRRSMIGTRCISNQKSVNIPSCSITAAAEKSYDAELKSARLHWLTEFHMISAAQMV